MDIERDVNEIRENSPLLKYVTFLDAANICTPNKRWLKTIMEFWD